MSEGYQEEGDKVQNIASNCRQGRVRHRRVLTSKRKIVKTTGSPVFNGVALLRPEPDAVSGLGIDILKGKNSMGANGRVPGRYSYTLYLPMDKLQQADLKMFLGNEH